MDKTHKNDKISRATWSSKFEPEEIREHTHTATTTRKNNYQPHTHKKKKGEQKERKTKARNKFTTDKLPMYEEDKANTAPITASFFYSEIIVVDRINFLCTMQKLSQKLSKKIEPCRK